jgi:hypothetical protein
MIRCKPGYEWDAIIVFFSTRACPSSDPLRPAHSVGKLRPYVEFASDSDMVRLLAAVLLEPCSIKLMASLE